MLYISLFEHEISVLVSDLGFSLVQQLIMKARSLPQSFVFFAPFEFSSVSLLTAQVTSSRSSTWRMIALFVFLLVLPSSAVSLPSPTRKCAARSCNYAPSLLPKSFV